MADLFRCMRSWDDAAYGAGLLRVKPGDRPLVAAVGGEEIGALIAAGAERVVWCHPEPAEAALAALKVAATSLPYDRFRVLLGFDEGDAPAAFAAIRGALPQFAREFWDAHPTALGRGLRGSSLVDRNLQRLYQTVLARLLDADAVTALCDAPSPDARKAVYADRIGSLSFKLAVRGWFTRRRGDGSGRAGGAVLSSLERSLIQHPPADNPYVQWLLGPQAGAQALPEPLTEAGHAAWAAGADRVEIVVADPESVVRDAPAGTFTGYLLSAPSGAFADGPRLLATLVRASAAGAKVVWWAATDEERTWPTALVEKVVPGSVFARQELGDRGWMHGGLRLATVRP
jgi:S-adenosylmethionine:diacylglycerol 3-amino-3-carboxypropyl transferase